MTEIEAANIDSFTTEIYRVAIEKSPSDFVQWCFDRLVEIIPASGIGWAYLMADGTVDSAFLHGVEDESALLRDYERVRQFDKLTPYAMQHQNKARSANALDPQANFDDAFKEFTRKHRIPKSIVIVSKIPPTSNLQIITLWRQETDEEFNAHDEAKLERCLPHLVQGLTHSRQFLLRSRLLESWSRHNHVATVTNQGLVVEMESGFSKLVKQHWSNNIETELPPPLFALVNTPASTRLRVDDVLYRFHRHEAINLFIATELGELARLTDRELEIGQMFAGGMDHKQIAEEIRRSSATVRNHLRSVYQKMNVSTRTELAAVLDRLTPFSDNSSTTPKSRSTSTANK